MRQARLRDRPIADRKIEPAGQHGLGQGAAVPLDDAQFDTRIVIEIAIENRGEGSSANRRHHAGTNETGDASAEIAHLLRRRFETTQQSLAELVIVFARERGLNALRRSLEQFYREFFFKLRYLHRKSRLNNVFALCCSSETTLLEHGYEVPQLS